MKAHISTPISHISPYRRILAGGNHPSRNRFYAPYGTTSFFFFI